MSYTMTTPAGTEQGPNIRSQDVRYRRAGGDMNTPYRDDPNAPVHLESYTRGGLGPISPALEEDKKNRHKSSCWNSCCQPTLQNQHQYYWDDFNDQSWSCTIGTTDEHGIWLNRSDPAGTIMAAMVWVLLGYSSLTITLLSETGGTTVYWSMLYSMLVSMALACHVKTALTDPGSVPPSAVPTEEQRKSETLSMCSQCQTFKPPLSHHCRICNRCISRMDHHCPWMNNCVGAGNMKHFFLFLLYCWLCSVFSLLLLGWNYFFCNSEDCVFHVVLIQLVRLMTFLSIGSFLFTSSMIMNVIYGLMTGIGTIDRLKKKAQNTMNDSLEEPIPLTDIFGIGPLWTWPFPIDPVFEDFDRVMGYSTPQRLLREQILREQKENMAQYDEGGGGNILNTPQMASTPGGFSTQSTHMPPSHMMIPPV